MSSYRGAKHTVFLMEHKIEDYYLKLLFTAYKILSLNEARTHTCMCVLLSSTHT